MVVGGRSATHQTSAPLSRGEEHMSAQEGSESKAQIRGSTLLLAGQAFAVLVNLAIQVLIVRYLSQESYGAFAYALSVALLGEAVARFGMRRGAARYMPLYEEEGDRPRV